MKTNAAHYLTRLVAYTIFISILILNNKVVQAGEHWVWELDVDYTTFIEMVPSSDYDPSCNEKYIKQSFIFGTQVYDIEFGFYKNFGLGDKARSIIMSETCDENSHNYYYFCPSNGKIFAHAMVQIIDPWSSKYLDAALFTPDSKFYLGPSKGYTSLFFGTEWTGFNDGLVHIEYNENSDIKKTSYFFRLSEHISVVRFFHKLSSRGFYDYCPNSSFQFEPPLVRFGSLHQDLKVAASFLDDYNSFIRAADFCMKLSLDEVGKYNSALVDHVDTYGVLKNSLEIKVEHIFTELGNEKIPRYFEDLPSFSLFERLVTGPKEINQQIDTCSEILEGIGYRWTVKKAQELDGKWSFP